MTQRKKIAFVNRSSPYHSSHAQESLDILLMASAFENEMIVVFMDDGVFQLKSNQQAQSIQAKNFTKAFKALPLYEINKVLVDEDSLIIRGLKTEDLFVSVELVKTKALAEILKHQDVIFNF